MFETTTQYEDQLLNFYVSFYFFKYSHIGIIPYAHLYGLDKLDNLTKDKIEEVTSKAKEYYEDIKYILDFLTDYGGMGGSYEDKDDNRLIYFSIEDVRPKPPEYFEVERGEVLNDYYNIVKILKNPKFKYYEFNKPEIVPNDLDTLKKLLSYFEIADDIFLKEVGHLDDKIFYKVYLRKKNNFFTLDKLSSGSIQLLPFLLQLSTLSVAYAYYPGALYLRQPELHLHPKIQMEIPELIATYGSGMNWCIETHSEHIIRKFQILVSKNENLNQNMELNCSIENLDNGNIKFILKAKRIKLVENEYLPSSENFVVEIYDKNSSQVWSSSYSKNFFMVITDVKPKNVGDSHTYTMEWNLKGNDNKTINKGNYIVKFIIPAKPKSYICSQNLELE